MNLIKIVRGSTMIAVVIAIMGASDCGGSGSKTPQGVLTNAFEALEANNVELWNKTLLSNSREPNPYRDTTGMINFKKLVGLQDIAAGKQLNLLAGASSVVDSLGQVADKYEAKIMLKASSAENAPSKLVALSTVLCTKKSESGELIECWIMDFFEPK